MDRSGTMNLEEEAETNQIDVLPDELILNIFQFLPLDSILECEKVCSRWKRLSRVPGIWKRIVLIYSGKPGQSEMTEKSLSIIETHHDCIRCLKLQYVNSYPVIMSILQQCHNLVSIELVMCRINKEFDQDIRKWPNLKRLNMKNSLILTTEIDVAISYDNFKYLNYLALADFGLPSVTRETLFNCNNLSHIFIEKIKDLSLEYIHNLIKSKMCILQAFHFYGGEAVSDETMYLISQCNLLKDLAVVRSENLTDAGLIKLANLKVIERLQIWNNIHFTESIMLKTLSSPSLIKLKGLSLSRIGNISPKIVDLISEYYTNLNFLALYQCPKIINTDYEKQLSSKFRNINVVLY